MDETTPQSKSEIARRLPRHDTDNRVVLTVPKADGPEKVRGRASNISEAGFGVVLAGELQIGDVVQARLVLQALADPLEVTAQVKNRHGFSHGFAFVNITAEQRRTVMRYLRAASHEDTMSLEDAHAMNAQHAADPEETTAKLRFSPEAYAPKPDGHESTDAREEKRDGGE
ncbi:MAG: PilZ domain-containing protein [Acidobacteriota bacterium]|nr:PilZ domain-containing protein [Acidobacteriota bacterium]